MSRQEAANWRSVEGNKISTLRVAALELMCQLTFILSLLAVVAVGSPAEACVIPRRLGASPAETILLLDSVEAAKGVEAFRIPATLRQEQLMVFHKSL